MNLMPPYTIKKTDKSKTSSSVQIGDLTLYWHKEELIAFHTGTAGLVRVPWKAKHRKTIELFDIARGFECADLRVFEDQLQQAIQRYGA